MAVGEGIMMDSGGVSVEEPDFLSAPSADTKMSDDRMNPPSTVSLGRTRLGRDKSHMHTYAPVHTAGPSSKGVH